MNMDTKRIFLLSGKQGAGKTTYAKYLQAFLGFERTKIIKFAEVLYKLHDSCLPILKEYGVVTGNTTKDGELLQVLGTEYGRKLRGENVWVDVTKRQVHNHLIRHSGNFVIIDDLRFENEFLAFEKEAYIIRLHAPEDVRKERCTYWRKNVDHPSEVGLDEFEKNGRFNYTVDTQHENSKAIEASVEYLLKHLGVISI